jgi:hypothetical protein
MTGYYAQWNIAPNGASELQMYVRLVQIDNLAASASEPGPAQDDLDALSAYLESLTPSNEPASAVASRGAPLAVEPIDSSPLFAASNLAVRDGSSAITAGYLATEPLVEPSFEWPIEVSGTKPPLEFSREPSLDQLTSSAADYEPSSRAEPRWSLETPSEPLAEPFLKALPDSSSAWPSEPTWTVPAEVVPEQRHSPVSEDSPEFADSPLTLATTLAPPPSSEPAIEPQASGTPVLEPLAQTASAEHFGMAEESASEPEYTKGPTSETEAAPTALATLAHPTDFSDLIALAGPLQLDEHYHDHPSGGRTPLPMLGRGAQGGTVPLSLEDGDEADALATLTAEYQQALLHQKGGYSHELKNVATENAPITATPNDPFTDLQGRYAGGSLLEDLLGSNRNIDALLDSLDKFGAEQIFEADERHEILALLAPGGACGHLFPQPAQLARQEHHLISVDSHIPMVDSTQHDE